MLPVPIARGRLEAVVVTLIGAVLLGSYVWAAQYRTDPLDEGYFIYTSSRVLAGELPYRDFSTPYTPGFFYLNAGLFRLFGMDLLILHLSLVAARLVLFTLTYLIARRLTPPAFAAVPVMLLLAQDQAPANWESHPAWWATSAMLLAVWCVCRHYESGRTGWWAVAGLAAGVAFAFKQNIGLFALASVVTVALTERRTLPPIDAPQWVRRLKVPGVSGGIGRLGRMAGPLSLLGLGLITVRGMHAHLDLPLLLIFAAPFLALAAERVASNARNTERSSAWAAAETSWATRIRLLLAASTFAAVTLPWLIVLLMALGPSETPFGAFVGAIDTTGYYLALEAVRPEAVPVLVVVLLLTFTAWAFCRPWPWLLRAGVGAGALALAVACVGQLLSAAAEVHPRAERAAMLLSVKATGNLVLYLPVAAFWSAYGLLMTDRVPAGSRFYLRLCLLAGSLLLLNQYPRMDEVHMLFSGPLLWIVVGYSLWRLYAWITRNVAPQPQGRLARAAAYAAVLSLPLAAVWPLIEVRREHLLVRQSTDSLWLAPPPHLPIDLPGASVLEIETSVLKFRRLAAYFREHTQPGERIFVYPAAPLLYYLVDRPNATRFNHVLGGLLSAADEAETLERLASVPATYVIWDTFGAEVWTGPGDYQRLTDAIWNDYDPVESIGGYEIMRRKGP